MATTTTSGAAQQGAPVRVVQLAIEDERLSEALLGAGNRVAGCEVVFRNMLPAPPEATLRAVLGHGLVLGFEPDQVAEGEPTGLLVPWGQVAYLRLRAG